MVLQQILEADKALFLALNSLHVAQLDFLFLLLTELGGVYFWILVGSALLLKKNYKGAATMAAAFLVNFTLLYFLKDIVGRQRPGELLQGINILASETGGSFPSGHSSNAFLGATLLGNIYKKYSKIFYTFAVLVFISRIYIGVHYPIDVVGGALLGLLIGKVFIEISKNYKELPKLGIRKVLKIRNR